jgi:hypothetical protein
VLVFLFLFVLLVLVDFDWDDYVLIEQHHIVMLIAVGLARCRHNSWLRFMFVYGKVLKAITYLFTLAPICSFLEKPCSWFFCFFSQYGVLYGFIICKASRLIRYCKFMRLELEMCFVSPAMLGINCPAWFNPVLIEAKTLHLQASFWHQIFWFHRLLISRWLVLPFYCKMSSLILLYGNSLLLRVSDLVF